MRLETSRLSLRRLSADDAGFILRLLNEPSFLRYVGDKGVRTRDDAARYIETGPLESYRRLGFGLFVVELRATGEPIGICGLLKREALADPDLGFAFGPAFQRKGYAFESASAIVAEARSFWGLERIVAITTEDNDASVQLLGKLGFTFEGMVRLSESGPPLRLFGRSLAAG